MDLEDTELLVELIKALCIIKRGYAGDMEKKAFDEADQLVSKYGKFFSLQRQKVLIDTEVVKAEINLSENG